ncbi:Hypothetical predicted protein [Cloeon dipterum]|uniref:Uncharacterized protein n=1 Tax=Cloeon dipterum TaxID=197152 RepID=A0A8S1DWH5_9INSE|nr:Hypothetical predicted protein [Cloeon dipterum]
MLFWELRILKEMKRITAKFALKLPWMNNRCSYYEGSLAPEILYLNFLIKNEDQLFKLNKIAGREKGGGQNDDKTSIVAGGQNIKLRKGDAMTAFAACPSPSSEINKCVLFYTTKTCYKMQLYTIN